MGFSRIILASRALVLNTARVGNDDDIDEDDIDDDDADDYIIMTCTMWRCLWVVSSAAADAKTNVSCASRLQTVQVTKNNNKRNGITSKTEINTTLFCSFTKKFVKRRALK